MVNTTETYNIIAAESVFTFKKEILSINFTNGIGELLRINFNFLSDIQKENKIESRPSTDLSSLDITVFNAEGIGGTSEPLKIAESANNKEMFISFSFNKFTESFLVQYTIFEEK